MAYDASTNALTDKVTLLAIGGMTASDVSAFLSDATQEVSDTWEAHGGDPFTQYQRNHIRGLLALAIRRKVPHSRP